MSIGGGAMSPAANSLAGRRRRKKMNNQALLLSVGRRYNKLVASRTRSASFVRPLQ
jgi:hypothetical protein